MRYFKSHLTVVPRLSKDNIFYMDPLEAGLMSHGRATIVGINKEAIEISTPDYKVVAERARLVHDALLRMNPQFGELALRNSLDVACVKPDITNSSLARQSADPTVVWQDLNIRVFEPSEGWVCAIPGKMTEAPALARAVADHLATVSPHVSHSSEGDTHLPQESPPVNLRPADCWMARAA